MRRQFSARRAFFCIRSIETTSVNMEQQKMDTTTTSLEKKIDMTWLHRLPSNDDAEPVVNERSGAASSGLQDNLYNLGLVEIPLHLRHERDSLFASIAFWEQRNQDQNPQVTSAEVVHEFRPEANKIEELRFSIKCPAPAFGRALDLASWARSNHICVFLVFPDAIQRLPQTYHPAKSKIAIFSCCDKFFFRPVMFRPPSPAISSPDLATYMLPFLGRILESSMSSSARDAIELSLGSDVQDNISLLKNASALRFAEDDNQIVFFGPQGVGKSRFINNILATSMKGVTDDVYSLMASWNFLSFQSTWVDEEINTVNGSEDDESNDAKISWAEQSALTEQKEASGYVLPEGNRLSTTSVKTEVKYGSLFAITFIFHTEEYVASALESYKRKLERENSDVIDDEEIENKNQFHPGQVMVGSNQNCALDPAFKNKLGNFVRYCSPYTTVADSLKFIKQKQAYYAGSKQNVWGLISSIVIEMPVPILRNGGRLIDSPGLVDRDAVRREQTMTALNRASAIVYVSSTKDFTPDLSELETTSFWREYIRLVISRCFEAKKNNTEPKHFLPKIVFAFNSDRGANWDAISDANEHMEEAQARLKKWFLLKKAVAEFFRKEKGKLPLTEVDLLKMVESTLFCINSMQNHKKKKEVKAKTKQVRTLEKLFVQANTFPFAPETLKGPIALMHVQFSSYEKGFLSAESSGVSLLFNFIRSTLTQTLKMPSQVSALLLPLHQRLKSRIQMENIQDEQQRKIIQHEMDSIRKRALSTMLNIRGASTSCWSSPTKKMLEVEYKEFEKVEVECTLNYLYQQLEEIAQRKKTKSDELLNGMCREGGEFGGFSMVSILLEPAWRRLDSTLKKITEILLPPPDLPTTKSLQSLIKSYLEREKVFQRSNNQDLNKFIEAEEKRFLQVIDGTMAMHFNYEKNFLMDKESLKIYCQKELEKMLTVEEKKIKARFKLNARKEYLTRIIPAFVKDCIFQIGARLKRRVSVIIDNFIAFTDNAKLPSIVKRALDDMTRRYTNTADKSELESLTALQNYFNACHLSVLESMIDSTTNDPQPGIFNHVLKTMVSFQMGSSVQFSKVYNSLEWRILLDAYKHMIEGRWSFLEKKVIVEYLAEINTGSLETETITGLTSDNSVREMIQRSKQTLPLANSGTQRTPHAFKNIANSLRARFLNLQEGLDHFNCYLNVHEDVQRVFFPHTINLRNLQLRKLILEQMKTDNDLKNFERTPESKKKEMLADINFNLRNLDDKPSDSVISLSSLKDLDEAVSMLQLEFGASEEANVGLLKEAKETIQRMLDRISKKRRGQKKDSIASPQKDAAKTPEKKTKEKIVPVATKKTMDKKSDDKAKKMAKKETNPKKVAPKKESKKESKKVAPKKEVKNELKKATPKKGVYNNNNVKSKQKNKNIIEKRLDYEFDDDFQMTGSGATDDEVSDEELTSDSMSSDEDLQRPKKRKRDSVKMEKARPQKKQKTKRD